MRVIPQKIAFIGSGHMANALVAGLISQQFSANHLWVSGRKEESLLYFSSHFHVQTTLDNKKAADACDVIVLCVKPNNVPEVCKELREIIQIKDALVISVAAGVTISLLNHWLGEKVAIIRAMPNTPSRLRVGVTGYSANTLVTSLQKEVAETIFDSVGSTFYFSDENQLDSVTALSGCGPAYVFLFMEALQKAAIEAGLSPDQAKIITKQMVFGAAQLATHSHKEVDELRREVTSKGGATEQALQTFQEGGFDELVAKAFNKAKQRAEEISLQLQKHGQTEC